MNLPCKRVFLGFHRWMGIASAIFLLVLALTGLALNHTERLGLNQIKVSNGWILQRYGMLGASDISSFRIGGADTLSHMEGQLYLNGEPLAAGGLPTDLWQEDGLLVIATAEDQIFITADGEFVERVPGARDAADASGERLEMETAPTDEGIRQAILKHHQGEGLSLYRVLLDLHSGRLFGWGGRTVMDLTAVAIVLLVSSGLGGWLRKSPWA